MSKFTAQFTAGQSPISPGTNVLFDYQQGLITTWVSTNSSAHRLGGDYNITQNMVNAIEVSGTIWRFFNNNQIGTVMQDLQRLSTANTWWTIEIDTDYGNHTVLNVTVISVNPKIKHGSYRYLNQNFDSVAEVTLQLSYNKNTPYSP